MKRRVWVYALTAAATAAVVAGSIASFCEGLYAVGVITAVLALIFAFCLAGEIVQDNFRLKSEKLFAARKFDEEREMLERVQRNHLIFPFVRETFYFVALRNAAARDDLEFAKSYVERLRHGGDRGLKYKTAYVYTLILLDEGNVTAARAEYEDFRIHNERYAIYQSQLEVLGALFARLFTKNDTPLPEAAVNSPYPVVKRILGRHFEERAISYGDWEE